MAELLPLTTAAWRRLRIAWHNYRCAVHESKAVDHLNKIVALREQERWRLSVHLLKERRFLNMSGRCVKQIPPPEGDGGHRRIIDWFINRMFINQKDWDQ